MMANAPDFEGFARHIMAAWPSDGIDGFELQEAAERFGLLRKVAYCPEKHGPCEYDSHPGDDWFVRNYPAPTGEE
jgi:hypothetical protein